MCIRDRHRRASGNTILCNDSEDKQDSVEEKHTRKSKSRQNSASSSENEDMQMTFNSNNDKNSMIYVAIIATSFVLRGTTAIFWLPLVLYHCKILYENGHIMESLIQKMIPVAILVLVIATTIDSIFHGKLAFTHWNFFKLNLLVDVNTQCGVSNGFMTLLYLILQLNFAIISFGIGLWKSLKDDKVYNIYLVSICWTVYVFSNINHQEPRFILPLLPLSLIHI